jgi:hypothetical protein
MALGELVVAPHCFMCSRLLDEAVSMKDAVVKGAKWVEFVGHKRLEHGDLLPFFDDLSTQRADGASADQDCHIKA